MFDIGFPELVLVAIVGLLVIGPERLPEALRTLGLWLGRMRRSFTSVKNEIEKEIGMDEVRRQLHNEAIMDEMKRIEAEVRNTASDVQSAMNDTAGLVDPASSRAAAAGAEAISSTPDAEPGTEAAADAAADHSDAAGAVSEAREQNISNPKADDTPEQTRAHNG